MIFRNGKQIALSQVVQSHLEQDFLELWETFYPQQRVDSSYRFLKGFDLSKYDFSGLEVKPGWSLDIAHVPSKTAVEINGGAWMKRGGHNTGKGLIRDWGKMAIATLEGWAVITISGETINDFWVKQFYELQKLRMGK